jgi:hypothetical protein
MLHQLLELVKANAGEAIIDNPEIPNEKNQEAIQIATNGISDFLKNQVSGGNIQNITSLFQGGLSNNLIQNISTQVAGNLGSKLGLSPSQSNAIVQKLIPIVIEKFISKTNDPQDNSFDLQNIITSLGGSSGAGNLLGKLGGFFK